ncbi:MAG: ASCH domain-containing protein [Desulfobacteraceae bacterium]|nr:ASCH domain-containing protein [Desulfobacteraceae bacterium]
MKAISLWQPWASLMALGHKTIETRSWPTNYRGPLAIHAAKRVFIPDDPEFQDTLKELGINPFGLPVGAIVGVCELGKCTKIGVQYISYLPRLEELFGDYTPGRFAWEILNMIKLETPIPCRGRQGLFEVEI